MAKTEESIVKLPDKCVKTINNYVRLLRSSITDSSKERWQQKLRGYLTCLNDLDILTKCDLDNLYLWVISGHYVGESAGVHK